MRAALILSLTYIVAAAAIIGLSSCAVDTTAQECFGIEDCGGDQICFLGSCQDSGYAIKNVYAEINPPASSGYLQDQRGPLDLSVGDRYQLLMLRQSITLSGTILADAAARGGTLYATTPGIITGRDLSRQASVNNDGNFLLRVLPSTYELDYVPYAVGTDETERGAARPPFSWTGIDVLQGGSQSFPYPDASDLIFLSGRVLYADSVDAGVGSALVSGAATTSDGIELASSYAVTNDAGVYNLVFPPGAEAFEITVQPPGGSNEEESNPFVPQATVACARDSDDPSRLEDIILGVAKNTIKVQPVVHGIDGGPVANASIFFEGTVGDVQGRYQVRIETNAQGEPLSAAELLPGDYSITVVPEKAQPYAIASTTLGLSDDTTGPVELSLTVGRKIRLYGIVQDADANRVGGASMRVTHSVAADGSNTGGADSVATREYDTTTAADGSYELWVDPGADGAPLAYEVVIEPPNEGGLPRHRELLHVGGSDQQAYFTLFPATFVYGQVLDPSGAALAQVTIAFYTTELSADGTPMLVGLGYTAENGEFTVPLPTLNR